MTKEVSIRSYQSDDLDQVLGLFRLQVPTFFAAEEEVDLKHYLLHEKEHYFLLENQGEIIGAGGLHLIHEQHEGRIAWDFIHPDYHGQRLGSMLLQKRLQLCHENPSLKTVKVRTSQMAWKFYEKHGFQLLRKQKDFWAPGFDLYEMNLSL